MLTIGLAHASWCLRESHFSRARFWCRPQEFMKYHKKRTSLYQAMKCSFDNRGISLFGFWPSKTPLPSLYNPQCLIYMAPVFHELLHFCLSPERCQTVYCDIIMLYQVFWSVTHTKFSFQLLNFLLVVLVQLLTN